VNEAIFTGWYAIKEFPVAIQNAEKIFSFGLQLSFCRLIDRKIMWNQKIINTYLKDNYFILTLKKISRNKIVVLLDVLQRKFMAELLPAMAVWWRWWWFYSRGIKSHDRTAWLTRSTDWTLILILNVESLVHWSNLHSAWHLLNILRLIYA